MADLPAVPETSKPTASRVRYQRQRMCSTKQSFPTRGMAQKVAEKFGQTVYECPICFCWHCTHLKSWRDEFVRKDYMDRRLHQQESAIREELNSEIRELKRQIKCLNAGKGGADGNQGS